MISRFEFSIPGTPEQVGEARALLASFLAGVGVPIATVDDAVLAGCELVTNAILYSASGLASGKVTVRAEAAPGAWAQVDVCDQGPISADRPLSPFQAQTTSRTEGGLGLFLVAGLSSQNGAEDSTDGHHVWFRITWPTTSEGGHRDG